MFDGKVIVAVYPKKKIYVYKLKTNDICMCTNRAIINLRDVYAHERKYSVFRISPKLNHIIVYRRFGNYFIYNVRKLVRIKNRFNLLY